MDDHPVKGWVYGFNRTFLKNDESLFVSVIPLKLS